MFTGIIQCMGRIACRQLSRGGMRLRLDTPGLDLSDVCPGDSIAVSGVCLTVVVLDASGFTVDVSSETLALTTLGQLKIGDRVNLEKALRLQDRLGGHLVSGHIDGIGKVIDITPDGHSQRWSFEVPSLLSRYIAVKGSLCIDGTSLTINMVTATCCRVNLIPHTLENTTFQARRVGDAVNLEVDMIARYVQRLLSADPANLDRAFLEQHGFA